MGRSSNGTERAAEYELRRVGPELAKFPDKVTPSLFSLVIAWTELVPQI